MNIILKRLLVYIGLIILCSLILYTTGCIANAELSIVKWGDNSKNIISVLYFLSNIAAIITALSDIVTDDY